MKSIVGVFDSPFDARRFAGRVRALGVDDTRLSVVMPGEPAVLRDEVPTTDAEQPGTGAAIGGVVGGATGAAAGLAIAGTAMIPGIGPVTAFGTALALAALGVLGGAAAGGALDHELETGIPADEMFVYEDALRQGRTVVVVLDGDRADEIRALLRQSGAESIDPARRDRSVGLGDATHEQYRAEPDGLDQKDGD